MENKIIWSTHEAFDDIKGLSDEEKFNALVDKGYDPDMLASHNMDFVIDDDSDFYMDSIYRFSNEIAPMIARQTKDGIVLMVGKASTWQGQHDAGLAIDANDLAEGDIDRDVTDIDIIDDGEGLVWEGHHHDGTHVMSLYAIPESEDELSRFVKECMGAYTEELIDTYELSEDEAFKETINDLDEKIINDYCYFGKVPSVCARIKNELNEDLDSAHNTLDEATTKNPHGLANELQQIEKEINDIGLFDFVSAPFSNYDNDDISIEYRYPEFAKMVRAFFKEMGLLTADEIKNPDACDRAWYDEGELSNADLKHDIDTILAVCKSLISKGAGSHEQITKFYKNGFNDGLTDKDKEESLTEAEAMPDPWGHPKFISEKDYIAGE